MTAPATRRLRVGRKSDNLARETGSAWALRPYFLDVTEQRDTASVISRIARLLRPLAISTALALTVAGVAAQPITRMVQPSISGSYIAGQQALTELNTGEAARYFMAAASQDWDDPVLVERAFIGYAIDGQIGRAVEVAKHLLTLDPRNGLARIVVATEAVKERRYAAAANMLNNLGQDNFTAITGTILRAWAMVGDNRAVEADALLVELGRNGLEDFLVFHRALMAEAAGNAKTAIRLATTSYENEPLVARLVEVYSRMLAQSGDVESARDVIDAYTAEGLAHPLVTAVSNALEAGQTPGLFATNVQIGAAEMYHSIGSALARDGSRELAIVFLRLALYLDPSADVVSVGLGQIFDAAGRYEAANVIYEAVPANSVMKPTAVVRIANNLDSLGDREEAIRRLRNIVAVNPDDLDAVAVLGDILRYDEQYEESAEAYTRAIELTGGNRPNDWRFFYVRGIAYERDGQWEQAEPDFQRALELNPDQPQVLNYLGYSWVDMGINLDEALEMIETAVEAQPQDGYIVDSLGWAFYKLGRIDEAVETLERAVQLLPNDPEINDHLGDAYWVAGRRLEARFQWNIAASVDETGNVRERVQDKLRDGLVEASATP
jgi:tetratricopeptide (TPR) repeat protein